MHNELSKIDLAGTSFFIDGRLAELRKEGPPFNIIRFNRMEELADGESMVFLFDKESKTLFEFTPEVRSLPPSVVLLKIPHEGALDPVGYARRRSHEISIEMMLEIFPIKPRQIAEEIPIAETNIPKLLAARNMTMGKKLDTRNPKKRQ